MPKKKAASKVADVAMEEAAVAEEKRSAAETVNLKLKKKKKKASKVAHAAKEEAVVAEDKKQTVDTVNLKLKKASKVPNAAKEFTVAVAQNPVETVDVTVKEKKKARDEIDEIFASKKKTKKPTDQIEDKLQGNKSADGKPKKSCNKKMIQNSSGSKENDGDSRRRRTNDGLTVFSESELGINRPDAGGTKLCPFDCDCCF